MKPYIEVANLTARTPVGRPLFDGLDLRLGRDRVALIGRNGVGKSTLLGMLAGELEPDGGRVVLRTKPYFVPQTLSHTAESSGERRRHALDRARASGAEILLLDEPSENLDESGVAWLRDWLRAWPHCLVVATHDRRILAEFESFFIASETGCRSFGGTLAALDAELEREHHESEERYAANVRRLAKDEAQTLHVARRKARKKRYGRCSELDRATPRIRLNAKRSDAQVSHGRLEMVRAERLDALRVLCKTTRRAVGVSLAFDLPVPDLPAVATDVLVLHDVTATSADGRCVVRSLDLRIGRERIAVVGPNGAGKTTLLEIMAGRRAPAAGSCLGDLSRIGVIAQGAADWMLDDSLHECLRGTGEELATVLAAHRFPIALAARPLRSLSPGERARAALITLFRRAPAVELLILDEPTHGLDLVGRRAMTTALRAWPGGLIVASHDRELLAAIGTDSVLDLDVSARSHACTHRRRP